MDALTGVAALADRPVDGRKVAIAMACVAIAMAVACGAMAEYLLESMNAEPAAAARLRALPERTAFGAPGHVAVVLVDGMRTDEAARLDAWRLDAWKGEMSLPLPTLSRPFYHLLFTGVPPDGSGVRSNRFDRRARHESVPDRVRAAGGRVFIVADGLDWMRRMFGGDGGSDAHGSIDAPLDGFLREWRAAPAPALLIVHAVGTDATAHAGGIHTAAHRAELARADRVIARVAAAGTPLFVLSDHGHIERGGHGGPEPEVARAPLLWRGGETHGVVDPTRLAATISAALGVAAPRSACGSALGRNDEAPASAIVRASRHVDRASLAGRRMWTMLVVFFGALLSLGPIKRAYRFDRSVPIAIVSFPLFAIAAHYALGLPLSLSAIDGTLSHSSRIAAIGVASAIAAFLLALGAGSGPVPARIRRAAAAVGWSAWACALHTTGWVGFALGPWPLDALDTYLPLLACGASGAGLAAMAIVLFSTLLTKS